MRTLERIDSFTSSVRECLGATGRRAIARVAMIGAMAGGMVGAGIANDGFHPESHRAEAASLYDFMSGSKEKEWCRWPSRWNICNRASNLAQTALYDAQVVGSQNNTDVHNGSPDAFRHCEWSGDMVVAFGGGETGADTARGFTDRHEASEGSGEPQVEADMDQFNNEAGRKIGMDSSSYQDVHNRCVDAMSNGKLTWIAPLR